MELPEVDHRPNLASTVRASSALWITSCLLEIGANYLQLCCSIGQSSACCDSVAGHSQAAAGTSLTGHWQQRSSAELLPSIEGLPKRAAMQATHSEQ